MLKKKSFLRSSEGISANYDFTDVADGTGVLVLYGVGATTSAGSSYLLTANRVWGLKTYDAQTAAGTYTYNFDLTGFNSPRTAKGVAYVNVAFYMVSASDSVTIKAQVKKYSNSTETNISSEISSDTYGGAGIYKQLILPIPLTQTNFKRGDQLRLTIKMVKVNANGSAEIGFDPQNNAGTLLDPNTMLLTTSLIFYCPFRIDV